MGKSSKRDPGTQKKGKKKKNKVGPDVLAMKVKAPKENPFVTIWSRRKFDILGKKRKGEERRVGIARSRGIEKRNKTLLKDFEQREKSSVFVDKRIGEKNEDLDEFGKAVLRSQRELQLRSKLSKKSKYNLSDGEEEEEESYEGLGIQERDDFEDEMISDDDAAIETDEPENNSSVVGMNSNTRISGEEGEPNKHKSKKEVMDEIISKSKFFKAQKSKEKEENEQLLEDLDQKFTALIQSKALLSLTEPRKMNSLEALVNKSITIEPSNKESLSGTQKIDTSMEEKPDAYDKLVKEMALEMRARPSDRTKTPEEIAQEERERLERLEEERQKRMAAAEDSSDEDDENSEIPPEDKPKLLSGDDLGDSFSVSEETIRKKGWIDEILERENAEDSASDDDNDDSDDSESSEDADEDPDEYENNLSLKDWEQSDDENIKLNLEDEGEEDSDDEEEEGEEAELHERVNAKKKLDTTVLINAKAKDIVENGKKDKGCSDSKKDVGAKKSSVQSDIPFIIEAPKTFEELCSLLDNRSNSDIIMFINRIRASNAIKLAAENRKKMQVFYGNLLQYFAVVANKKPLNFELLNSMGKPLIEMSMEIPFFATICARQRIERARKQLVESLKNPESSSWPSSKMLFLLRLWSLIFPSTDFRHPVMTLAILLMCEYLMRCPILSGRDVAIGAFLCSMLLSIFKQSRKFCPEAIIFLRTMLVIATEKRSTSGDGDSQFYQLVELKAPKHLLCMQEMVNEIRPLNFIKIVDTPEDSSFFSSDDFRASALAAAIETLRGFVNIYDGLSSFPEIFLPVLTSLHQIEKEEKVPNALRDKIKDVTGLIQSKVDEHHTTRRPLQMRKKKPEPIKLLNPKFEENYVKGRDYDPDRERAQRRKLYKQWKRESKRAASELRKDSAYLYDVRDREKALLDQEKAEKYGRARAFLQEQEHAFKSGQLGKGRKRRR